MKRFLLLLPLIVIAGLVLNWVLTPASHDRDWRADYSRLPSVSEQDGLYRVANTRNWDYAEDGAVTRQEWIEAEIDPDTLTQAYFLVEPFGSVDAIAHTMLVFTFADGAAYVASIEARREVGEAYSAAKAAVLPIFEYMFVWTTERDMYGNSEFMAGDALYRYALDIPLEQQKAVLKAMLDETAEVEAQPRWYHTLFSNCTNVLARTVNKIAPDAVPLNKAWFLTGYADEFLYEQGFISNARSFEDTHAAAHISAVIRELYDIKEPKAFSSALKTRLNGG
ncbi:lipoprotein N-acyltransferase Lnb domain-containing protein [Antarctobacter jejuensis]|uniref:lipoprotein N-acyltransferase Lnb domain-containing protein n=1 Tax=Antarctobacter jejuensis TaxID=1439938 RepID=UPI003FD0B461